MVMKVLLRKKKSNFNQYSSWLLYMSKPYFFATGNNSCQDGSNFFLTCSPERVRSVGRLKVLALTPLLPVT